MAFRICKGHGEAAGCGCSEWLEHLALGLCANCYRSRERKLKAEAPADKYQKEQIKKLRQARKVVAALLNTADDALGIFEADDVIALRLIAKKYLGKIGDGLPVGTISISDPEPEQDGGTEPVQPSNSEAEQLNTEQQSTPEDVQERSIVLIDLIADLPHQRSEVKAAVEATDPARYLLPASSLFAKRPETHNPEPEQATNPEHVQLRRPLLLPAPAPEPTRSQADIEADLAAAKKLMEPKKRASEDQIDKMWKLAEKHPEWPYQKIGDKVGMSAAAVGQHMRRNGIYQRH